MRLSRAWRAGAVHLLSRVMVLVCGCRDSVTTAPEETPQLPQTLEYTIYPFDSYAGDGVVRAYWDATPMFEPTIPARPWPDVREVRLEISTWNPNGPYHAVAWQHGVGPDSAVVTGLTNGTLHYLRVVSCDSVNVPIGMSWTLESMPGPTPTPLVEFPAYQRAYASPSLAWSPRGDRLAFVKADGCIKANVYAYDFATTSIQQLTPFAEDEQTLSHVSWSSDGSTLVFGYSPSRTNYLSDYRIWTLALAGDATQSVTAGPSDACPAWATNRAIAFVRYTNSPRAPEIHRLDLPSTTSQLTFDGKIWKMDLAVSPDGHWIAYSGYGEGNRALYVLAADGGASEKLTAPLFGEDIHPVWHPHGRTLYFASSRSGHYEIWSVGSNSGGLQQVTHSQVRWLAHFGPALTADGSRLAYFASRGSPTTVQVLSLLSGP